MKPIPFADLPLFATDAELARALLGAKRASMWHAVAPLYEQQGLQKIDPLMGGRYTRAVLAFFDRQYGLTNSQPLAPPGREADLPWNNKKTRAA